VLGRAVVSELRRLGRFIATLALFLAPLLVVLWFRAGDVVGRHPTRAVIVGVAWIVFVARLTFAPTLVSNENNGSHAGGAAAGKPQR
jgi:hypothetical protein